MVAKQFFDGKPPTYDINKFAINLSKEQNLWCGGVFYYTAPPYQSPNLPKPKIYGSEIMIDLSAS